MIQPLSVWDTVFPLRLLGDHRLLTRKFMVLADAFDALNDMNEEVADEVQEIELEGELVKAWTER